jgi:hypothetical protein
LDSYYLDNAPVEKGPTYQLAQNFGRMLLQNCEEVLGTPPVYKDGPYMVFAGVLVKVRSSFVGLSCSNVPRRPQDHCYRQGGHYL